MHSSLEDLADRFRITKRKKFRLKKINPADTGKFRSPAKATELLQQSVQLISELQEKLYAEDKWAVLLIFQAMDAAGKDPAHINRTFPMVRRTGGQQMVYPHRRRFGDHRNS